LKSNDAKYLYLLCLLLKSDFGNLSLNFVRLSCDKFTDKLAINWQNFPQV